MAKKVIRYACEWGCRRPALAKKDAMERHEKNCFLNPARRACKTCLYGEDDGISWSICPESGDSVSTCGSGLKMLRYNCDEWEAREDGKD
jgi:hypothetical protein